MAQIGSEVRREISHINPLCFGISLAGLVGAIALVRSDWISKIPANWRLPFKAALILTPTSGLFASWLTFRPKANQYRREIDLSRAIVEQDLEEVSRLLDEGASLGIEAGMRPLHAAANYGSVDIVDLLLTRGADKESRDPGGCTPLIRASKRGKADNARALLDAGAATDACNARGHCALHLAAARGCYDLAELLVQRGADLDLQDPSGKAPFQIACESGHYELALLLVEKGADLRKVARATWMTSGIGDDLRAAMEARDPGSTHRMDWLWWQKFAATVFDVNGALESRLRRDDPSKTLSLAGGHHRMWSDYLATLLEDESVANFFVRAIRAPNPLDHFKEGNPAIVYERRTPLATGDYPHPTAYLLMPDGRLFVCNQSRQEIGLFRFDPDELWAGHIEQMEDRRSELSLPLEELEPIRGSFPQRRAGSRMGSMIALMQLLWVMVGQDHFDRLNAKIRKSAIEGLEAISKKSAYPNEGLLEAVRARYEQ